MLEISNIHRRLKALENGAGRAQQEHSLDRSLNAFVTAIMSYTTFNVWKEGRDTAGKMKKLNKAVYGGLERPSNASMHAKWRTA
ncbi:uncharacterized protein PAC_19823 [Phialocephala subalpina]|uniref:Uncharacterized protein n=1 Tax=Phialocephala subalpina TaxID=576137 RepID=A0A1L7XXW8_9HELO|nr:uncharacterized protein PAC_19823 [Phialocephala subalpina]